MKMCIKCEALKKLDEFHKRGKGVQPYCKECRKRLDAEYWQLNKERLTVKKNIYRKASASFYEDMKKTPCTDCGNEFHHAAMQWDHIGTDKAYNLSRLKGWGVQAILKEIEKCELVCSNCHAIRTYNRSHPQ